MAEHEAIYWDSIWLCFGTTSRRLWAEVAAIYWQGIWIFTCAAYGSLLAEHMAVHWQKSGTFNWQSMAFYWNSKGVFMGWASRSLLMDDVAFYWYKMLLLIVQTLLSLLVNHTFLRWQNATLYSALFSRKSGSLFAEQVTLCWQVNGSSIGTTVPVYLAQHDARYSAAAAALSWRSMGF